VVGPGDAPDIGTIVEVVFDMKKVHFFDPDTEETIV